MKYLLIFLLSSMASCTCQKIANYVSPSQGITIAYLIGTTFGAAGVAILILWHQRTKP